jgi:hypothetical protein
MKKFIIIAIILILVISTGVVYLNKVVLPSKIQSLIVSTLKQQTGKNVTLQSLEFNIFKGLVLHDLVIADGQSVILSTQEASCTVFIWPIFKKQIIIPSINLKAPYIFLERRPDNSFNLQDFLPLPGGAAKKPDFNVSVLKISVKSGNIVFQDDTLAVKSRKELKNIQFNLQLGLPVSVKFNFKAEITNNPPVYIHALGEYKILSRDLSANATVKNLSTQEFQAYYNNLGDMVSGLVDLQTQINFKDRKLQAYITAQGNGLVINQDKFKAKLSTSLQTKIDYNLQTRKIGFNGTCYIAQADILGLEALGEVKNIHGKFTFNERSLVTDSLKAELLGMPFEINLGIKDFNTPVLNINTNFDLKFLPGIARDKFNLSGINSAVGRAVLSLKIHPDNKGNWIGQGGIDIAGATLKLDKLENPVENIGTNIEFSQQGLSWEDTKFRYQGIDYNIRGTLFNFSAPNIKLKLFSPDLSMSADFNLLPKKIKIIEARGKYLDSQFLISGDIDNSDLAASAGGLNGTISLELSDLNIILAKQYPAIKSMQLSGVVDGQFKLNGNLADFKNCSLQAKLTSSNFSFYGLKAQNLSADLLLDNKIVNMPAMSVDFYDGKIEGVGALNLGAPDFAYKLELKAGGIQIEKLKMDTVSKNKDISGTFVGEVKLDGSSDLSKLSGAGSFAVSEGKLWELNLLQGLGKLLFAKDLANIKFSECSADFQVKDKFVTTDNLKLKSEVINLTGALKIGFDNSLAGALNVELLANMGHLSDTLNNVATAILGQSTKLEVVKLSGTLGKPKYDFQEAVTNVIQGLTDIFLKGKSLKGLF